MIFLILSMVLIVQISSQPVPKKGEDESVWGINREFGSSKAE